MPAAKFVLVLALALVTVMVAPAHTHPAVPSNGPISITPIAPLPNSTINTETPTIEATFADTAGRIPYAGVSMIVDGRNVSGFQGVTINATSIIYSVNIFNLTEGNNTVTVALVDDSNHSAQLTWNFSVNTALQTGGSGPIITFQTLLLYVGGAAGVAGAAFGVWLLYLKLNTRFTFRKYFILHPQQKSNLALYVPAVLAAVVLFVGLDWSTSAPNLPPMTTDYVVVGAIFLGTTAFAVDARRELARTRSYERAFAQFLFEMADAMRGGIDPAKAVIELSKTTSNILAQSLRIAADALRIGRPFEAVLREMTVRMPSSLIKRYAALIADASGVGGETALVVYRAAKDMDDFVKIEEEREKQLTLPVAVVYIAFAVLMAVLFALLYITPSLGSLNISFIGGGGNPLASSGASNVSAVPKLTVSTLHERFFQLMLINSIGTGAIIGAFTEGKARYGLLHSLGLAAATTIAFTLFTI